MPPPDDQVLSDLSNHLEPNQSGQSTIRLNSWVIVWFDEVGKEYIGRVNRLVLDDPLSNPDVGDFVYEMDWKDRRCKRNEHVVLNLKNLTRNILNCDRWYFLAQPWPRHE
jgi:hypothetical protein